ncbi:hypothetical protein [uncultured Alteromonas sp.]|uniref:hypothetical protein n=1 Tax=uncultured Alteromonas sp. TaxID=179113 RepID=UPI0030EB9BAE|tara:strand:+ start:1831 stop:2094 length:264 start_codon:yes stop_codon:yes gene_type:complete
MKLSLLVKSKKIEGKKAGDVIKVDGVGDNGDQIPAKYVNLVEILKVANKPEPKTKPEPKSEESDDSEKKEPELSEKKLEGSTPSKKA